MAEAKTLEDLFLDTLKDIYYAEKQIVKTLPKMAKAASSPQLKAGFEKHLEESEVHVERLEQVFEMMGKPARGKTCEAILGIIEEGKTIMEEFKGTIALDAGLISAAQAVEHYEISRYGTLRTWADQLGMRDAARLFQQTLAEEEKTDKTLDDLFLDTLKDIYYAENQIVKTLPKMAKAAQSSQLKSGFEQHLVESQGHVERLEQVFDMLGKSARGKTCEAILGIIDEGKTIMDEFKGSPALDAGLISAAQAVEHYEISRYGTLKAWAEQLGLTGAVPLLDATLKEEMATDKKLSQLAETAINAKAA
jgi:ferritin-like metal-binding protein YciE